LVCEAIKEYLEKEKTEWRGIRYNLRAGTYHRRIWSEKLLNFLRDDFINGGTDSKIWNKAGFWALLFGGMK